MTGSTAREWRLALSLPSAAVARALGCSLAELWQYECTTTPSPRDARAAVVLRSALHDYVRAHPDVRLGWGPIPTREVQWARETIHHETAAQAAQETA